MADTERVAGPRRGRPSAEQAQALEEQLLTCALDVFLARGFEATTMEAIAAAAQMSKRTLYSRFSDKSALFLAAVARASAHYTIDAEQLRTLDTGDLSTTLRALAKRRLENLATPNGIRLHRILATESYRFPSLQSSVFSENTGATINFLTRLFEQHPALTDVVRQHPREAAIAFMSMVLRGPAQQIISGVESDPGALEDSVGFTVDLFLNGAAQRR